MLNLRALAAFIDVAERLNLSRAAESLHISQSALTRQIQALESDLGVVLFDRIGKRLALTAAGQDLLPRAAALLDHARETRARAGALAQGEVGLLRIGASPQTIEALLSGVLQGFRQAYPAVETIIVEAPNDTLVDHVRSGATHVSLAAPVADPQLVAQELFWAKLYAVVPPQSRWVGRKRLDVTALAAEPLLNLRKGFLTRTLLDQASLRSGVRLRTVLESDSAYALIALARAGMGVAVVSSTGVAHLMHEAPELMLPLVHDGAPIRHAVAALWPRLRHRQQALVSFVDELKRYLARPDTAPHLERHPALGLTRAQSDATRRKGRPATLNRTSP